MKQCETKSDYFEFRVYPSLKARAKAVAASKNTTLSDYAHDLLEAAVAREERRKDRKKPKSR